MDRKVWLPSGGSLVIDRTEAMTVVDVNTGKFVGSGGNLEETVTKNNLEAAEEIVRQLRLRDIGGIIVIDFIDMVLESNRDLVVRRLLECLGRDRTKHQVAEVTSLGLVQMTRKRVGSGLVEVFSEQCEHCGGRGIVVAHRADRPQRRHQRWQRRAGRRPLRARPSRHDHRHAPDRQRVRRPERRPGRRGPAAVRTDRGPDRGRRPRRGPAPRRGRRARPRPRGCRRAGRRAGGGRADLLRRHDRPRRRSSRGGARRARGRRRSREPGAVVGPQAGRASRRARAECPTPSRSPSPSRCPSSRQRRARAGGRVVAAASVVAWSRRRDRRVRRHPTRPQRRRRHPDQAGAADLEAHRNHR